MIYNFK